MPTWLTPSSNMAALCLRERAEEPGDALQATVGRDLTEVHAFQRNVAIGSAHRPRESEHVAVRIDAARVLDGVAGHHLVEPADVGDESLAAFGAPHWVLIDRVIS